MEINPKQRETVDKKGDKLKMKVGRGEAERTGEEKEEKRRSCRPRGNEDKAEECEAR